MIVWLQNAVSCGCSGIHPGQVFSPFTFIHTTPKKAFGLVIKPKKY